jgi:hypothetical protein
MTPLLQEVSPCLANHVSKQNNALSSNHRSNSELELKFASDADRAAVHVRAKEHIN